MRKTLNIIYILVPLFATAILTSCGTSRNTATVIKKSTVVKSGGNTISENQSISIPADLAPQSQALLQEASRWLGTPYKYGGEDKSGVDCSGLVMNVYRSALSIKMPRNSKAQSDYCTPVPKNNLTPGDLLFFATSGGKTVSHVGIFIGDNRMIHSSTSKGVIVSDINADYYVRTFAGSGRVEQYHAMLSSSKGNTNSGAAASPTVTNKEIPSISLDDYLLSSSQSQKNTGSTNNTTVNSNNHGVSGAVPETITPKIIATITPADSALVAKEVSTEDARTSVLNSIIEQKLDSIYNK